MVRFAQSALRYTLLLFGLLLILLALMSAAMRLGLPLAAGYKSEIESRVSDYLQRPVTVGTIEAQWNGFGPQLVATDVAVIETPDQQIGVDTLVIDLNLVKSLWNGSPAINDLTLVGADLSIAYTGDGAIRVQGVSTSGQSSSKPSSGGMDIIALLLNAGHINLEDARVTFIDADQKTLSIEHLNILARNDDGEHFLRVDMQLPQELGGKVSIGVDLSQSIKRFSDASGRIHIQADQLQFGGWRSLRTSTLRRFGEASTSFSRLDGTVDMELWGTLESGRLATARGKLTAANILDVRNGDAVLDRFTTDVSYTNKPSGWVIESDVVELQHGSETSVIDKVEFAFEPSDDVDWTLASSSAEIPLALALRLPAMLLSTEAGESKRDWLIDAAPSGVMHRWNSLFSMKDGKADISVDGSFYNVSITAAHGLPGLENLAGSLDIQNNRGKLNLIASGMGLDYPKILKQAVVVDDIQSELQLDFRSLAFPTIEGTTQVNTHGVEAQLRHKLRAPRGRSPHVDLQGQFQAADMGQLSQIYPARLFRKPTQFWLENALQAGRVSNGEVLFFGNLSEFPFDDGEGVFRVGLDVEQGQIDFLKSWPAANDVKARVDFRGRGLSSTVYSGEFEGMQIISSKLAIDDLKNPILELESATGGTLNQFVRFGSRGPLKKLLRPALGNVNGTGNAHLDLELSLPLKRPLDAFGKPIGRIVDNLKLDGNVFLKGNTITQAAANLKLTGVSGAVGFNEKGIRISNLNAGYLGHNLVISTDNKSRPNQRAKKINISGAMQIGDVLAHYKLPIDRYLSGSSHWNISLDLAGARKRPGKGIELLASSDMVGTRITLPQPLSKSTSRVLPLSLRSIVGGPKKSTDWYISVDDWLSSRIVSTPGELKSLSIKLGGGELNDKLTNGIRIDGSTSKVALDAWVNTVAEIIDSQPGKAGPEKIMPVSIDLLTTELIAGVESLGAAQLRANSDVNYVNVALDNRHIQGNMRYPREHWKKTRSAKVRIAYAEKRVIDALISTERDSGSSGKRINKRLDPRKLPPLEMRVSQFVWGDMNLKDLSLRAKPDISGMQIEALGFATATTQLIGNGYWRVTDPQSVNAQLAGAQHTRLNLTLQSDEFGDGFRYMGLNNIMDEGTGRVNALITWPDSLYAPSIDKINGTMNFDLERGRIIKIDPGAARLVGLFALQSMPRRLSLDFNDMVEDGLDFDTLTGRIELANGISNASAIQLNGPIGVIEVTGETNMLARNFDQTITVLPRVSSALPIIGAITGGASGGISALVAGGVLKAIGIDFDRIGLREYRLTGNWDKPSIEQSPYDPVRGY